MASDAYDVITDRIMGMLEEGVVPWRKTWTVADTPKSVHGHTYRGINAFVLAAEQMIRGYSSRTWITFRQAKKLGGHVRKGEKGTPVVFWKWVEKDEEQADGSKVAKRFAICRYYTVFNLSQCEGLEDPNVEGEPADHEPIAACEAIVAGFENAPEIGFGGSRAFYSPPRDEIQVPELESFESPEAFYATLFHEMTHSTGHESRLARPEVMEPAAFGDHSYSREELVAEMGAAFLSAEAGISGATIENSAAYLAGWLKALKDDRKMLVLAAARAQKAADRILGREVKTESEAA